jgi:hypothetical protein
MAHAKLVLHLLLELLIVLQRFIHDQQIIDVNTDH